MYPWYALLPTSLAGFAVTWSPQAARFFSHYNFWAWAVCVCFSAARVQDLKKLSFPWLVGNALALIGPFVILGFLWDEMRMYHPIGGVISMTLYLTLTHQLLHNKITIRELLGIWLVIVGQSVAILGEQSWWWICLLSVGVGLGSMGVTVQARPNRVEEPLVGIRRE